MLKSLQPLREYLLSGDPALQDVIEKAHANNPWFTPEFIRHALTAIGNEYLDAKKVRNWSITYQTEDVPSKKVAIIMAGNVPLVGFHDLICVLSSGHRAMIKLSEKDSILPRFIIDKWKTLCPELSDRITYSERLEGFDAVIATGSNNSGRYFEYYFRDHPHILRRNRNGVAVLTGNETVDELRELSKDIFIYYGLGCRNVSKIYVPRGYDFSNWHAAIDHWAHLGEHHKYKNNLDYNFAIFIINQLPHIHLGHLILKEDEALGSRIGSLHYTFYTDMTMLTHELEDRKNEIQCLISSFPIKNWKHVNFGQSQIPSLNDYADGIDTMQFLTTLGAKEIK